MKCHTLKPNDTIKRYDQMTPEETEKVRKQAISQVDEYKRSVENGGISEN